MTAPMVIGVVGHEGCVAADVGGGVEAGAEAQNADAVVAEHACRANLRVRYDGLEERKP